MILAKTFVNKITEIFVFGQKLAQKISICTKFSLNIFLPKFLPKSHADIFFGQNFPQKKMQKIFWPKFTPKRDAEINFGQNLPQKSHFDQNVPRKTMWIFLPKISSKKYSFG